MRSLGNQNDAILTADYSWPVELVKLTIDPDETDKIVMFTNHFHDIIVGEETYLATGNFLGFSSLKESVEAKDSVITVSLSGVNAAATSLVLNHPLSGSVIEILRGFYDEDSGELVQDPYSLWAGHVNNFSIQDDYDLTSQDTITISLDCKSLLTTFLGRQSGVHTSIPSFQKYFPGDTSMEFVAGLSDKDWQFGNERD